MYQFQSYPASLLHTWRGQIATLSLRGGGRYRVLRQQATLFPRFAAYYAQLRVLPKHVRRQLQRRWTRSLAGVALFFALGQSSVQAVEFTAGNAAQLNAAITTANSTAEADTIKLTQDIVLTMPADVATDGNTGTVVVTSPITIEGQGHDLSRAQGAAEFRLLRVASTGDLTVRQTTLHGGQVGGQQAGGGVLNSGSMTLEECTISDNSARKGGGIASYTYGNSRMAITSSTISGNSAREGGGVYSRTHDNSSMRLIYSTVSDNFATFGGGVYGRTYDSSRLRIEVSTISGNSAARVGGGVGHFTFDVSEVTLRHSTINGNTATKGGGLWSVAQNSGQIAITNSTVSGNTAHEDGGGVVAFTTGDSQITLINSTISGNSAASSGGGVSSSGRVTLEQMLVAGNHASRGAEVAQLSNGDVFYTKSNLFGHDGLTIAAALDGFFIAPTDRLATSDSGSAFALSAILDPTLADNGGLTFTHNLVPGSPAIDAGGVCLTSFDQRGVSRPQGGACDIGAVEGGESCGNCVDDDGDGLVDFADPDCTTEAEPITKERASFTLSPAPRRDQLTLTATLPGGHGVNPPQDGLGVQFLDDRGSLLCVHLPPASAAPGAWKTKLSTTNPTTTWQFTDAPNGSLGDPSKDAGTVSFDPIKDTLTVKLTIKQTEIGGDATARNITTGIGSGVSRWQKLQRWTAKAGGKKLGTP